MNEKTAEYAGNLLAVMHGDGGHYISDHGWKRATDDAITKYYALTSERDEAVRQVVAMRSFVTLLRAEDYLTAKFFADEIESRLAAAADALDA